SKNSSEAKSALDIYLEALIDEIRPSAKEKIDRYIYRFGASWSLDDLKSLTIEFREGVLNDCSGKASSSLSFSSEELTYKIHVEATTPKFFVGTDEHKDRIYEKKAKRKSYDAHCSVHTTQSGSHYVDGHELYRCCDPCDSFVTWMSEELEPFEEGIDFIKTYRVDGLLVYILTLPTAISIVSTTEDFCFGEEYRKDLIKELRSKLEDQNENNRTY
ncbi:MAG: hypothetical protein K2H85_07615, partial [Allobaculum sp.]|nr:hypothetical protein [Allobaculum sp.]